MRYTVGRDGQQVGDLFLRDARSVRAASSVEDAVQHMFPGATRVQTDPQRIVLTNTKERYPYASVAYITAGGRGVFVTMFASKIDVDAFSQLDLTPILGQP